MALGAVLSAYTARKSSRASWKLPHMFALLARLSVAW